MYKRETSSHCIVTERPRIVRMYSHVNAETATTLNSLNARPYITVVVAILDVSKTQTEAGRVNNNKINVFSAAPSSGIPPRARGINNGTARALLCTRSGARGRGEGCAVETSPSYYIKWNTSRRRDAQCL